jgi:hypothetical protein
VTAHEWTVVLVHGMWNIASESGYAVSEHDLLTLRGWKLVRSSG